MTQPIDPIALVLSGRWTLIVSTSAAQNSWIERSSDGELRPVFRNCVSTLVRMPFMQRIDGGSTGHTRYMTPKGLKQWKSRRKALSRPQWSNQLT